MIKLIGYWLDRVDPKKQFSVDPKLEKYLDKRLWEVYIEEGQYPWPGDLVDKDFWTNKNKQKIITYLESGIPCNYYLGFSGCRLCNQRLGSFEKTDGYWIWPDKFEHYINEHNIRLPMEFLDDIASRNYEKMTVEDLYKIVEPEQRDNLYLNSDDSLWIKWAQQ